MYWDMYLCFKFCIVLFYQGMDPLMKTKLIESFMSLFDSAGILKVAEVREFSTNTSIVNLNVIIQWLLVYNIQNYKVLS